MTVPTALPIVQAPMAGGPSTPELAAAVAGAGAFGFVAGGYLTPDVLRDELDRTRALTSDPIGVNLFVPGSRAPDPAAIGAYAARLRPLAEELGAELGEPRWEDDGFDAKIDVLVSAGIHTASFTFGCPAPEIIARLRAAGVRVVVTVTDVGEAEIAAGAGADGFVVQGAEAGGHQGTFDPARRNETPLAAALDSIASVGLPMIATGGITTAGDARAALDAGAVAVQIGTALLCTPEARTSVPYRRALLDRTYEDTVITRAFTGRWARGLANPFAVEHSDAPGGYPEVHHLTRPLRAAATAAGNPDVPNLWAGTGWTAITAEPAADVVRRIGADL